MYFLAKKDNTCYNKTISGPFPFEKRSLGGRLQSGPFPKEKKVTTGGSGEISLKSETVYILGWPGPKFLKSGKSCISVSGSKFFKSENIIVSKYNPIVISF